MNIMLQDLDHSSFPNLALMKLSAWHKLQGDKVGFDVIDPDGIYQSCVFEWNADRSQQTLHQCEVVRGGSGFGYEMKLPNEIEHICPDYSLYDIDYSMGFTSRGCVRNCEFCIVPKKEGKIRDHAPITEFLRHEKVILLDNSFLQSPKWKENLEYCIDNKIKVNISQGIDVRLLTEEQAMMLHEARLSNHNFTSRALHIAWDYPQHETQIRHGIDLLISAGIKPYSIICYVLVGFSTTHEQDLYRVHTLWDEYGVLPFVMKYNRRKDDVFLNDLARWCNNRFLFKSCKFEDYIK